MDNLLDESSLALEPWECLRERLAATKFQGFPLERRQAYRAAASRPKAAWYVDGDARLALSGPQFYAFTFAAEGIDVHTIAAKAEVSPNRVARWLRTPSFRRAMSRELAQPTTSSFRRAAMVHGLVNANDARCDEELNETDGSEGGPNE